jgi:hypothetical protein
VVDEYNPGLDWRSEPSSWRPERERGCAVASRLRPLDEPPDDVLASSLDDLTPVSPTQMALVTVGLLPLHRCSVCGEPARASVYDLIRQQRTLLCGTCPLPSPATG